MLSQFAAFLEEKPVGFLVAKPNERGFRVVGDCCAAKVTHTSAVYSVNIYPYRQTCCECGKLLVAPQTNAWCELFNGQ